MILAVGHINILTTPPDLLLSFLFFSLHPQKHFHPQSYQKSSFTITNAFSSTTTNTSLFLSFPYLLSLPDLAYLLPPTMSTRKVSADDRVSGSAMAVSLVPALHLAYVWTRITRHETFCSWTVNLPVFLLVVPQSFFSLSFLFFSLLASSAKLMHPRVEDRFHPATTSRLAIASCT